MTQLIIRNNNRDPLLINNLDTIQATHMGIVLTLTNEHQYLIPETTVNQILDWYIDSSNNEKAEIVELSAEWFEIEPERFARPPY